MSVWDKARRWATLRRPDCGPEEVRAWLAAGWLEHQPPPDSGPYRPPPSARAETFCDHPDTLLALTDQGVIVAERQRAELAAARGPKPVWDEASGELTWQGEVVLVLRDDATDLRLVLETFQEKGWPPRLGEVWVSQERRMTKKHLADAIYRLTHHGQKGRHRARFKGDHHCGVCWEHMMVPE
jgi:hypothetical protein